MYKRKCIGISGRRNKDFVKTAITVLGQNASVANSTLNSRDITFVDRSSNDNDHARQGYTTYLCGVKVQMYVRNPSKTPKYFKVFVLSYKGTDSVNTPLDQQVNPISSSNFFRGLGGNIRAVDFNGVSRDSWDRFIHPINTDSYNVLWGKTFILHPVKADAGGDSNRYEKKDWIYFEKYIPVGREITYDNDSPSQVSTNGRIFLVYYCDTWERGANGVLNSPILVNTCTRMFFVDRR